jgi:hypothetical protein
MRQDAAIVARQQITHIAPDAASAQSRAETAADSRSQDSWRCCDVGDCQDRQQDARRAKTAVAATSRLASVPDVAKMKLVMRQDADVAIARRLAERQTVSQSVSQPAVSQSTPRRMTRDCCDATSLSQIRRDAVKTYAATCQDSQIADAPRRCRVAATADGRR